MARTEVPNPWLSRRVLSYAHQGGAWEAPSSTLFAIKRALDLGATGIELDVHATADRRLVVCHDSTVDRTTNGHGPIHSLDYNDVRSLDNAYWFVPGGEERVGLPPSDYPYRGRAPKDPEFAVASLEDVLELMDDHPTVALNLDIKATAPSVEPYEELLAEMLAKHANLERVIVASFLDAATAAFSRFAPDITTSPGTIWVAAFWAFVNYGRDEPEGRPEALQVPVRRSGRVVVDRKFVDAAHSRDMAVHVWTVNEKEEMEQACELGVDGVISDLPTSLLEVLERRGLGYKP